MLRRAIEGVLRAINQSGYLSKSWKTVYRVPQVLRLCSTCCGGLVVEMVLIAGSRGVVCDAVIALGALAAPAPQKEVTSCDADLAQTAHFKGVVFFCLRKKMYTPAETQKDWLCVCPSVAYRQRFFSTSTMVGLARLRLNLRLRLGPNQKHSSATCTNPIMATAVPVSLIVLVS